MPRRMAGGQDIQNKHAPHQNLGFSISHSNSAFSSEREEGEEEWKKGRGEEVQGKVAGEA